MKFLLITAIVGFAAAADVTLDTKKLTDFTSEFAVEVKDFPVGPREAIIGNGEMSGKLQLNLLAEKLKFAYEGKENWEKNAESPQPPPRPPFGMLTTGLAGFTGEIVIDGPAGQATITEKAKVSAGEVEVDMTYCFHVKLPTGFVPPGGMLKQRVDEFFPRYELELNEAPHTVMDNGDLVYTNSPQDSGEDFKRTFTMKSDGTPVSWHSKQVPQQWEHGSSAFVNEEASLTVSSFTAGAGDVTPLPCVDGSVADLSEHPGVVHAAVVFDMFMEQIAKSSGLNLPSLAPLIEQQLLLAEHAKKQGAQQQSWTVALLAGVAGMAGGAVVLALDNAFRRRRDPPLLSEA